VILRLQFSQLPDPGAVAVRINGVAVTGATADGAWLEFTLPAARLVSGTNQVGLTLAAGEVPIALTDLHCSVRFGSGVRE
jgi:hypothetical protein